MKYIYILGLEHSGTTLLDCLLSQQDNVIGLGEVSSFFSRDHMRNYMTKWGDYPDAKVCSCGVSWVECPIWGDLISLNGANSNSSLAEKYRSLLARIHAKFPCAEVIVDSSKNIITLDKIIDEANSIGLERDDIFVVHLLKDVRNFTASIGRKNSVNSSLITSIKTFNWWIKQNNLIQSYLVGSKVKYTTITYESLCFDTQSTIRGIFETFQMHTDKCHVDLNDIYRACQGRSHIALGNKAFSIRNNRNIKYDSAWHKDYYISLAYLLHKKARNINQHFPTEAE